MAKLAHNLLVRSNAAKGCYPGLVVGWIGDAAHQNEQSDHNPDSRGVVHAIDFMCTGAHAQATVNWLLRFTDDLEYIIHNRVIWTRSTGWKPRKYTGSDPHTTHVHASGRHGNVGYSSHTGTGYSTVAEATTPAGSPCSSTGVTPKPPVKKPPLHSAGSRVLAYVTNVPALVGPDVLFLQTFLGFKGKDADSKYGPNTAKRVSWYEGMRGIHREVPYGVAGKEVWENIGVKFTG